MTRTKIVTTLVVLMGLVAIAAIVDLHLRDAAARDAQLQFSTLGSDLSRLQGAPLKSSATTGGSPEIARRQSMAPDEALAELERCSGTQFHPVVVATFCRVVAQHEHASHTPIGVTGPAAFTPISATTRHSERGTA